MKASIIEEKSRNFKPFILNISIENITDLKYLWLSFGMCIGSVIQYYKNKDHEKIEHQIAVEVLQKLDLQSKQKIWEILDEQLEKIEELSS